MEVSMLRKHPFSLIISILLLATLTVYAAEQKKAAVCSYCNMMINEADRKFTVTLPHVSGMGPSSYDDIGCAIMSRNSEYATNQVVFDSNAVVYDYLTAEAIPAEKAFFAFRSNVRTPMGYGIVAFKDKAQAEKFAAEYGKVKVLRWFELVDVKL
jgi:copper chaperone NosL